jgi:hypothetical protein
MSYLTPEQVSQLNERYGYFQYADSQGDVSQAFANDAIEAYERIRLNAPQLLEALEALVASLSDQDDEGMIEHTEQIMAARAAIANAIGEK